MQTGILAILGSLKEGIGNNKRGSEREVNGIEVYDAQMAGVQWPGVARKASLRRS